MTSNRSAERHTHPVPRALESNLISPRRDVRRPSARPVGWLPGIDLVRSAASVSSTDRPSSSRRLTLSTVSRHQRVSPRRTV